MNPVHLWILKDLLGLRNARRLHPERRCNRWRALGWALALVPWVLLVLMWGRC